MRTYKRNLLLLYFTWFILSPLPLFAQEFTHNFKALNAYYLEVGGNGDAYSLNYDRVLYQQRYFKTAVRVGIGTNLFFLEGEPTIYPVVPLEAIGMIGRKQKHFEFGLGYTRRFTKDPELLHNMYFTRIGFRYQVPLGGVLVRVAFTPFLSSETNVKTPGVAIIPRFGFSFGKSL